MEATFNIENHAITYTINWLGIETILLNGKKISKKLSLGKRVHTFELMINGVLETIHIESKQSFALGNVTISLFLNGELKDEKVINFYSEIGTPKTSSPDTNSSNSMFLIGVMFIVLSLCFDWSKFFLFLGLIFLFDAICRTEIALKTSESKTDIDSKDH
ncbi:hypothetical protein [Psychroserpens sp. MEBiC05023]